MLSWLLCLEKKQECCIYYLTDTMWSQSERRKPRKLCDLRYQCSQLIFFFKQGVVFIYKKYEEYSNQKTSVSGHIYSVKWLTEERIIKWQRPILTDGQFTRHKFVSESRTLYWQMTNKVKSLNDSTHTTQLYFHGRLTNTGSCWLMIDKSWLTAAYGTVALRTFQSLFKSKVIFIVLS